MVKRVNRRKLPSFENKTLKVGFFASQKYDDGTSMAQVARWNEFGTKSAPPRPFMRYAIEQHGQSWINTLKERVKATGNAEQALNEIGVMVINDIRDSILSGTYVGNSPLTLLLKDKYPLGDFDTKQFLETVAEFKSGKRAEGGHNKPLVWSGAMLRSISKVVE